MLVRALQRPVPVAVPVALAGPEGVVALQRRLGGGSFSAEAVGVAAGEVEPQPSLARGLVVQLAVLLLDDVGARVSVAGLLLLLALSLEGRRLRELPDDAQVLLVDKVLLSLLRAGPRDQKVVEDKGVVGLVMLKLLERRHRERSDLANIRQQDVLLLQVQLIIPLLSQLLLG